MVNAIPEENGPAEPADTLAPPVPDAVPETTDPGPVSSARDSAAPSTGAIPTPTAAVTPTSPTVDAAGLGTFGTPVPGSAVPGPTVPGPDYSAAGVPSLDYVRDKIEGRYAHSLGSTELAEGIPEVKSFEEQAAKREEAARDKLEQIRRSLRGGPTS